MNFKELTKQTEACTNIIQQWGIELTWGEKAALRHYIRDFNEQSKKNRNIIEHGDALHLFLINYFGLDTRDLLRKIESIDPASGRWYTADYGLGFIDNICWHPDPRFKKYCQNNISFWRDKRNKL